MSDATLPNIPDIKDIPFEFFSKPGNKTTKLINSKHGFSIEGTSRWYEFEFSEPVYLTNIIINSSGYSSWNKFDVEVFHTDETIHKEKIPVKENQVSLSLGKLCRKFRFKPDTKWLSETTISQVVASGYTLQEFHSFEREIGEIVSREQIVSDKEAELESANTERDAILQEVKSVQSQVSKLENQRTELDSRTVILAQQVKEAEAHTKDLQREIETHQEERRSIRSLITTDESTYKELTTKLRLFPSEIAGFVEQGNRNINTYIVIGIPFAVIFLIVMWSLFSSAIDLTQLWRIEKDVDVWTIFLTRIPFVIVAFALIEACGFIVGRLIFEIVKINRQRLDFSKLSIVAKDITVASSVDLEMTDEERFQEETKIKMGLLQEHMKAHSDEEFKYQGSAISSAIIGLANKLVSKGSG